MTLLSGSRVRVNAVLYALTVVLACAVLVGFGFAWRAYDDRRVETEGQGASLGAGDTEIYHDVMAAAVAQATAFVTISWQDLDASIAKVKAGATGDFAKEYDASAAALRDLMTRNKSVMTGEVISAGIVDVDHDSATVLVSTRGTVTNTSTKGEPQERNLRLQLSLVKQDEKWLTSDLQFVG